MSTSSDRKDPVPYHDDRKRRGEPVLLHADGAFTYDPPLLGTIEWGNDRGGYSICTEPGGARFVVGKSAFVPDPGGVRPLWERRRAEDGENVRAEIQTQINDAERNVVHAAMIAAGFRAPLGAVGFDLATACSTLNAAEKRMKLVQILGVRTVSEKP